MSSTFGGIQQALSSLQASRYGLQIVSQNIGNASTPGYTRQGVDLAALDTVNGVSRRYVTGGGPSGVTVTGTSRLNDPVVDARARTEHARSAQIDTSTTQLGQIENIFHEPSDYGLAAQLDQFWSDWADVANNPADGAARTVLLQDGGSLASTLNAMSQSLADVAAGVVNSLAGGAVEPGFTGGGAPKYAVPPGGDLAQANTDAKSLSELNEQIALAYNTSHDSDGNHIPGSPNYNALLDQRDQLLDQLSSLVGGVATINQNGTADVGVGGSSLVVAAKPPVLDDSGNVTAPAQPAELSTLYVNTAATDAATMVAIGTDPASASALTLSEGSAAASVVTLTDADRGLPHFGAKLDAVADALAQAVNTAQSTGRTPSGDPGSAMFGAFDADGNPIPGPITAANIGVTSIGADDVAAADASATGANHDGSHALEVSQTGASEGSPDDLYATLVGDIGTQSRLSQRRQATQDVITQGVDALRQSASGVNMDEEVSNMLTLQRTYQASSKVLSVMDSMLDTLINGMGIG